MFQQGEIKKKMVSLIVLQAWNQKQETLQKGKHELLHRNVWNMPRAGDLSETIDGTQ